MEDIFKGKGITTNNILHLSATDAYECCKNGAIIIDVREELMSQIKTFDIVETKSFPLKKLPLQIKDLPTDRYLIFADATGLRSKTAVELAKEQGYTKIANLAGGLVEWERDGMPVNTYKKLLVGSRNKGEIIDKNAFRR